MSVDVDYLVNVVECDMCGGRWCLLCEKHWAWCECPGPHGSDEFLDEVPDEGSDGEGESGVGDSL